MAVSPTLSECYSSLVWLWSWKPAPVVFYWHLTEPSLSDVIFLLFILFFFGGCCIFFQGEETRFTTHSNSYSLLATVQQVRLKKEKKHTKKEEEEKEERKKNHQHSAPRFWGTKTENKQSRSRGSPSTVTLMPASAEAWIEQITLQIRNHLEQLLGQFLHSAEAVALVPTKLIPHLLYVYTPMNMYQFWESVGTILIYLLRRQWWKKHFLFCSRFHKKQVIFLCHVYQGLCGKCEVLTMEAMVFLVVDYDDLDEWES